MNCQSKILRMPFHISFFKSKMKHDMVNQKQKWKENAFPVEILSQQSDFPCYWHWMSFGLIHFCFRFFRGWRSKKQRQHWRYSVLICSYLIWSDMLAAFQWFHFDCCLFLWTYSSPQELHIKENDKPPRDNVIKYTFLSVMKDSKTLDRSDINHRPLLIWLHVITFYFQSAAELIAEGI